MIEALLARHWRRSAAQASERGRWEAAAVIYERLAARGVSRPADAVRHAAALEAAGQVDRADRQHLANVARHRLSANVHRQRALFLLRRGVPDAAAAAFAQARALAGPDRVLDEDLRRLDVDGARARVEALAAFAASPEPEVRRPSRWARAQAKRRAKAAKALRSAGAWSRAVMVQREVLRLTPQNAAAHIRLGHALKESGDLAEAERAYWAGVALAPRDADGFLQLGHALKLNAGRDAALPAYLVARALAPGNGDVARDLADFELSDEETLQLSEALAGGDAQTFLEWSRLRTASQADAGAGGASGRAVRRWPTKRVLGLPRRLEVMAQAIAGDIGRAVGATS